MQSFLYNFTALVWVPAILLLIITGILITIDTRFIQLKLIKLLKSKPTNNKSSKKLGDIKPVAALMTSLAGAVGTGNITGIATAVSIGGYGAVFWMWVVAVIGMATAYAETVLSLKYRTLNSGGAILGGPMLVLHQGLRSPKIAKLFCYFTVFSAFGFGMVQSNSVADAIVANFAINRYIVAALLCFVATWIVFGGIKRIGEVASKLVPIMAGLYILISLKVILTHANQIIPAFKLILTSAFSGQAAVGGFAGSSLLLAIQNGAQFGVFANEAGLGSLAIANASARTNNFAHQGALAMLGVFVATMLICTITALVLAVTDVLGKVDIYGNLLSGSKLALAAFATSHYMFVNIVIMCLALFALTTIIAWAYYGEKCLEYIVGSYAAPIFKIAYIIGLFFGAILDLHVVWLLAHLSNGLMVLPNAWSIICLRSKVAQI